MYCPKCGNKMKCFDSANVKKEMKTARRYKCPECGKKLHTIETPFDQSEVNYILSSKWRL